MISIRPLTAADIGRLTEIDPSFRSGSTLELVRAGYGLAIRWELVERELDTPYDKRHGYDFNLERQHEISQRLQTPDVCFLRVAEENGRLVGMIDAEFAEWNNAVVSHNLYIDRAFRGQGVGRRFWDVLVKFAEGQGARAIRVETQTNNVPAVQFYLRMGCRICGIDDAFYDDSVGEIALFLEYRLGER
jgi:ribosomal protein S18 acetylase RimI-like enzyme